jgi:ELWxxDGT repeat protein
LANFDGNLYHSAFESSTGKEVWQTDGLDGSYLFADIYPSKDSFEPFPYQQFTKFISSYLHFLLLMMVALALSCGGQMGMRQNLSRI